MDNLFSVLCAFAPWERGRLARPNRREAAITYRLPTTAAAGKLAAHHAGEAPAYPASKWHPAPRKEGRMPLEYAPKKGVYSCFESNLIGGG